MFVRKVLTAAALVIVVGTIAVGFARIVATEPASGSGIVDAGKKAGASPVPPTSTVVTDAAYVDVRTRERTRLPESILSIYGASNFRISPDGSAMTFDDGHQIYVANRDGTDLRVLEKALAWAHAPMWSPDGRKIVYVGDGDVSVVGVESGMSTRLTHWHGEVWLPSFSPDGRTILFTATSGGGQWIDLWTISSDGGRPRRLRAKAAYGSYSPDGSSIAYFKVLHSVSGGTWPWDFVLRLVDADGRRPRLLDGTPRGHTMAPYDWDWLRPAWSPDGTRIAYQTFGPAPYLLRIVDVATGQATPFGAGALPSWADDTTLIIEDRGERCCSPAPWALPASTE